MKVESAHLTPPVQEKLWGVNLPGGRGRGMRMGKGQLQVASVTDNRWWMKIRLSPDRVWGIPKIFKGKGP